MASTVAALARMKQRPGNLVKGRVEIKGTRTGLSGLVIQVFDITTGAGVPGEIRMPLGSTVVIDGVFSLHYEDADFQRYRTDGSRPALLISVHAPEEANGGSNGRLFESAVREHAAREECFLIHIDALEIRSRGLLLPSVTRDAAGDPEAAGAAAESERERRARLRREITNVRTRAVAEARAAEVEMENELEERILRHLTGLPRNAAARQRFVQPGGDAQKITRENHERSIRTVMNRAMETGTATYLALSPEEYNALHEGGVLQWERVELKLREKNPTPTLLRSDPAALACLRRREEHPFDPLPPPGPGDPPPPDGEQEATVDAKVAELISSIHSPEDPDGLYGRPDQDVVAENVRNLRLTKGPADVAARYYFHNIQMAFDHVWEDARAQGVLEQAKVLYRGLKDLGGDPLMAIREGQNPIRALRKELGIVREAHAQLAGSAVSPLQDPGSASARTMRTAHDVVLNPGNGWEPPPAPPDWPGPVYEPASGVLVNAPPEGDSYPFTVFADKSINFGLLVTYCQTWDPDHYQVGRLVGTQTLAPKESISITTRQVIKTSFNQMQMQSSQVLRKEEASDTQREEAEIVSRAQAKTNFALTTEGSWSLGPLGDGSYTSTFGKDAESQSQETKTSFRNSVNNSAQEYRDERQQKIEAGVTTESENALKRDITNPNDELAVTYIFYELQRRYRVRERLHRVIPIILVGQYVPRPEEIEDNWVRRHGWIINRFLPDDSYRAALTYLATRERGDRIILDELRAHMDTLRSTVRDLKHELLTAREETADRYVAIEQLAGKRAALETAEDREGWFESAFEALAGSDDASKDALRILEESAREGYERAVREERDLRARLEREVTALQVATDSYIKALAGYTNQRTEVDRLIGLARDYIIHFMHAIWSYEQPDQRLFRHHTLTAPRLEPLERIYTLEVLTEWPVGMVPLPDKTCYRVTFTTRMDEDLEPEDKNATLAELADLDRPLGFKGNYIIFPLNKSNALTDFMMTPYLDAEFGLRDPDGLGNWTLEEFSDFVQCLRDSLSPEDFLRIEPELRRHYQQLLNDPLRDGEEIVVPTTSMYMQMIVDPSKALEDFKAAHRLFDVMKVKADVRGAEINNLRKAKLVLSDQLEDPEVESVKNVFYRGDVPPHDGDE